MRTSTRRRSVAMLVGPVLAWAAGGSACAPARVPPKAAEETQASASRPLARVDGAVEPTLPGPVATSTVPAQPPRVAAALARVPTIASVVASIRGLALKRPVPVAVQGEDDFRRFLKAEVEKEMPADRAARSVRALVRLGLLKQSIDLGKTVEDAMLSQAGAYYDPASKRFYLVLVPEDESMLDVMSAHELTHALDDQYFDLAAYTGDAAHELTNDAQQARRFVAEGEATLVMLAYQAKVSANQDLFDPAQRRMEQAMVSTFASLDSQALARSAAENPAMLEQMGPSMKASIDAMASIPPFILDPLFGAYTKGAAAVAAVRDAGGWGAVSALYTDPPESTEQLLHPREKLLGRRDHPVTFAPPPVDVPAFVPAIRELVPIDHDVVGELTMAVYFKNWGDTHPAAEVTGWGGDLYTVYTRGDAAIGFWLTAWDTEKDAKRFATAYAATLASRFPGSSPWTGKKGAHGVILPDGTVTGVVQPVGREREVYVVDGAPAGDASAYFAWMHHRVVTSHPER